MWGVGFSESERETGTVGKDNTCFLERKKVRKSHTYITVPIVSKANTYFARRASEEL